MTTTLVTAENINRLAFQPNALVHSKLRFSHLEARIFALALACGHKNDTELPPIRIDMRNVMPDLGGHNYELVKQAMNGLMKKTASVEKISGTRSKYTTYSLIDTLSFDTGTGMLTGLFAPSITPFLLQLRDNFTRAQIQTLLLLESAHTHRLYWILKSWDDVGTCCYQFDSLREMILGENCGTSYALYTDFKRHVLDPAVAELNELQPPWPVSYVAKKRGKKVHSVAFTIPPYLREEKAPGAPAPPKVKKVLSFEEVETFRAYLAERSPLIATAYDRLQVVFRLSEYQARVVLLHVVMATESDLEFKRLTDAMVKIVEAIRLKTPMKSVGDYTLITLKEVFPIFTKVGKKV